MTFEPIEAVKLTFLFRQIQEPKPRLWMAGGHWYVEAFDVDRDMSRPLAIAFVTDIRPPSGPRIMPPVLDYLIVCDDYRRQGIGAALVAACRERWPDILLTAAISPAGEALVKKVGQA